MPLNMVIKTWVSVVFCTVFSATTTGVLFGDESAIPDDPVKNLERAIAEKKGQKKSLLDSYAAKAIETAEIVLQRTTEGDFSALYLNTVRQRKEKLAGFIADPNAEHYLMERATKKLYEAVQEYSKIKFSTPIRELALSANNAELEFKTAEDWRKGLAVELKSSGDALMLAGDELVLTLNSENDYVETSFKTADLPEDEKVTFCFWVKPARPGAGVIIEGNVTGGNERWWIFHHYSNSIIWQNHGNPGSPLGTPDGSVPVGEWTHVAVNYNIEKTRAEIYLNGRISAVSDSQQPYTLRGVGKRNNNKPIRFGSKDSMVGKAGGKGGFFALKDVSIWNYVRSNEINRDFSCGIKGDEKGLLAYWPLNEGKGMDVYDKSSGARNGKITGAGWINETSKGYWISSPILIDMENGFNGMVSWKVAETLDKKAKNTQSSISVFIGQTVNKNVLPDEWREVQNGKEFAVFANCKSTKGKFLWLKTVISRPNDGEAGILQSLGLKLFPKK